MRDEECGASRKAYPAWTSYYSVSISFVYGDKHYQDQAFAYSGLCFLLFNFIVLRD